MAALTQNIDRKIQYPDMAIVKNMNVNASEEIFQGALIAIDAQGDAIPAPATASEAFIGVADHYYLESTAVDTTDFPLVVKLGHVILVELDAAVTEANIGATVWYTDDNLGTRTDPTVPGAIMGRIVRVDTSITNGAWVDTSERYVA